MPHELVVRIASSGKGVDLEQPLLNEMERRRRSPMSLPARTDTEELSGRSPNQAAIDDGHKSITPARVNIAGQPTGVGYAAPGSYAARSTNPVSSSPIPASTPKVALAQNVEPVAQRISGSPLLGQDRVRPMVAIDAGHGGFDPGTVSASGIAEKSVALAVAQRLAAALEARGIDCELTRNDDGFLSLAQRTELANRAHADLFVSIHLNSSPDWNTSGIESYYLNNTSDRATIRLARIENGGDYGTRDQSNLNYILTNLRQDYKAHESSSLARMIEAEVVASVDTTLGIKVKALGAKMGPFYVLVGAEMPSVLVECGFLSNPREAQFLLQPTYQQSLAEGIARAIMDYFQADAAVGNL
jgi:N-acetylmuramoyl-L-alanine amidase